MLNLILATVCVNVPLQIPYVPDIPSLTNISTSSTSDMPYPPTYEHLHRHFLPKKDGKNELVPYKKDFMSLITIVSSDSQSGILKLTEIFLSFQNQISFQA